MADLCILTGIFCDPAGVPFGGAKLVIRPVSTQPTVRGDGSIVAAVAVSTFETAAGGAVTIGLAPGLYRGSATQGAGGRTFSFDLAVPDLPTAPLADYIGRIDVEVQTSAQKARDDALAAVVAAQGQVAAVVAAGSSIVAAAAAERAAAAIARAAAETAVVNAQVSGLTVATWTTLSALTASVAGTGAEVLDTDIDTHTDPVSGTIVANAGRYSWSVSPVGWHRIGSTGLSAKAPLADPALTGIPTAPTAPAQTISAQIANAEFALLADTNVREMAEGLRGGGEVSGGALVLVADDGGPLDSIDLLTGLRRIENLALPGGDMAVRDGLMPILRDGGGEPLAEIDLMTRQMRLAAPPVAMITAPPQFGLRATEVAEDGRPLAGYMQGEYVRLYPERAGGLIIRGDHNRIQQLWWCEDDRRGLRQNLRQITFAQHGVTGYRWVRLPTPTEDGEVILQHGDTDLIRDRRFATRRAKVPLRARNTVKTKVVMIAIIGQSNSVGAGTNGSPQGVIGPQTIRTHLPVDGGSGVAPAWPNELMTFNGGTMPHQVSVDYASRDTPIDPARLASLVPMREGLGGTANTQGGSREGLSSALALHLAGPNGYDGAAYVISASFGQGGTQWQEVIHDGTDRRQGYLNLLAGVAAAQGFAASKSLPLEVHVLVDQGEANGSQGVDDYANRVTAFLPIMQSDVVAITGQVAAPQLFLAQTGYTNGGANEPCDSALGQLQAARANAAIHILPPSYWADHDGDTVHFKAPENQLRGALYGEVIADWLIRGSNAALYATAATWTGATISLQMTWPVETDAQTIEGLTAALGVSHINSGGAAVGLSVVQPDPADTTRLRVTCAAAIAPGTAETVRLAYSNAVAPLPAMGYDRGLRSGIRRADWRRYSLIDGRPLPIFANIQSIAATEV